MKYHPLVHTVNCFPKQKPRALQGLWPRPRQTGRMPCPCHHCWRKQWSSSYSWLTCCCVWSSLPLSCTQGEEELWRLQRHCCSCWTSNGQDFGHRQPLCGPTPLDCGCHCWDSNCQLQCDVRWPRVAGLASSGLPESWSSWPTSALPVCRGRSG